MPKSKGGSEPYRRIWLGSAILGSLFLLLGTGGRFWVDAEPWKNLLLPLNLGGENTIAAWWSGMLLFVTSVHAYDELGAPQPISGGPLEHGG